ncbi:MAG: hypothetical protein K6G62_03040 [Eubacterium sp.]|nr:hypothetical protein [Eubacterium sp.]
MENKEFKSKYTKGQRRVALAAVVLLVLLYLITLVAALTTSPAAPELFRMCIGASLLIPIMLWLYIRFWRFFSKRDRETFQEDKGDEDK